MSDANKTLSADQIMKELDNELASLQKAGFILTAANCLGALVFLAERLKFQQHATWGVELEQALHAKREAEKGDGPDKV